MPSRARSVALNLKHAEGRAALLPLARNADVFLYNVRPQAMERLQKLKDKTEAASYAEVIRNALRLFEALVEEHEKGAEFSLRRADGEAVQYKIFV